jgi:tRNA 2-thiocytidine biosynthesis protein TtcA
MFSETPVQLTRLNFTGPTQKLHMRLCRLVGQAVADFSMIEDGDTVMVCLSGGKDSYGMLDVLLSMQSRAPISYQLLAVNLDQKQPGFPQHILPDYLSKLGVPFHIEEQDTYSIVKELIPEGKTTCSLCSRLRRGILYGLAEKLGATKIALGHHRDDIVETMLLNMLFNGTLKAMPPKLRSDDGKHVVIRPLAYVRETELANYGTLRDFPIIPCDLCGSQENLKRQEVKALLKAWESRYPGSGDSLLAALTNVRPSQLLDRHLFDFSSMDRTAS